METIKIIEKPQNVSWDDIHKCLWDANDINRKKGIFFKTVKFDGNELRRKINKDAIKWTLFVALDGKKLVGCAGVSIRKKHTWYARGKYGYLSLTGVIPEYKGQHLNTRLVAAREQWLMDRNVRTVIYYTAIGNTLKIKADMAHGYQKVSFLAPKGSSHYCVVMCKWLNQCPFSKLIVYMRYLYKKAKITIRYKVGGKKRFGI